MRYYDDRPRWGNLLKILLAVVGLGLVGAAIFASTMFEAGASSGTFTPPTRTATPSATPTRTPTAAVNPSGGPTRVRPTLAPGTTAIATPNEANPTEEPQPTSPPAPPTPTRAAPPPTPTPAPPTATPLPTPTPKPAYPAVKLREPQNTQELNGESITFEWEEGVVKAEEQYRVFFKAAGSANWTGQCKTQEKGKCTLNVKDTAGYGDYEWSVFVVDKNSAPLSASGEVRRLQWRLPPVEPPSKPEPCKPTPGNPC